MNEDIESKRIPGVTVVTATEESSLAESHSPLVATSPVSCHHELQSLQPGESEVEQLASRIDSMYANRIPVTSKVKSRLLRSCLEIANREGLKGKIKYDDLVALRDAVKGEGRQRQAVDTFLIRLGIWLGFPDDHADFLGLLEHGIERCREIQSTEFYFQDFAFYNVRVASRRPWRRNHTANAFISLLIFYVMTPVMFCGCFNDKFVCPDDPTGRGRVYYGWLTSLYFASITMSTVGYGDVTFDKSSRWRIYVGILYMLIAVHVAISALSSAASASVSPFSHYLSKLVDKLTCNIRHEKGGLLHRRIYRARFVIIAEIVLQFMFLNTVGVWVLRSFLTQSQLKDQSWILSFYWAVQTTTTIGYGDVDLPVDFRWFQVLYLSLSTYFVGNALGRLGNLKRELDELRLYYAWESREASKTMIDDMKARNHDDKLDQYEFVVASLLTMRKISTKDVQRVMDKYRSLAGPSGYIELSAMEEKREENAEVDTDFEEATWEECDRIP